MADLWAGAKCLGKSILLGMVWIKLGTPLPCTNHNTWHQQWTIELRPSSISHNPSSTLHSVNMRYFVYLVVPCRSSIRQSITGHPASSQDIPKSSLRSPTSFSVVFSFSFSLKDPDHHVVGSSVLRHPNRRSHPISTSLLIVFSLYSLFSVHRGLPPRPTLSRGPRWNDSTKGLYHENSSQSSSFRRHYSS